MSRPSKLRKNEIVIEGMLKDDAAGAADGPGSKQWDLIFDLMPWKRRGEPELPGGELRVNIPVSKSSLTKLMSKLPTGAAVRFTATRLDPPHSASSWLAAGVLPVEHLDGDEIDAQLREARALLDSPVVIENKVLGTMTLDRELDWFNGERHHDGRRYELSVSQTSSDNDRDDDLRDLRRAGRVLQRFEANLPGIRAAIVKDKLELYNGNWRERRRVLSAKQFIAKITLSSAVIHSDGSATAYFDDGGLFLGHTIEVRLSKDGSVDEICLAG